MFFEKLRAAVRGNSSFLCVGLDPDPDLMPQAHVPGFLQAVVEATSDIACAYKPNLAFFEALGPQGMRQLMEGIRSVPAGIPVIADAKRGDIGNSARFYARALFDVYDFDAATVNPYGGRDSVEPFAEYAERGVFVWCRGSNPGAADFQDLPLADGRRLYEAVASAAREWNTIGNIGLVAGATWPRQIARVRELCPGMTLLVPGVGSQEGDLEGAVEAAMDGEGAGFLVNASRAVLYASRGTDYAAAARRAAVGLRDRINRAREAVLARR
jgi:orotidine-5'-phosphate decarboxylase